MFTKPPMNFRQVWPVIVLLFWAAACAVLQTLLELKQLLQASSFPPSHFSASHLILPSSFKRPHLPIQEVPKVTPHSSLNVTLSQSSHLPWTWHARHTQAAFLADISARDFKKGKKNKNKNRGKIKILPPNQWGQKRQSARAAQHTRPTSTLALEVHLLKWLQQL